MYICESESCSAVSDSLWPHGLYSSWNSPGQNTGVGSLSLFRGIFLTQWSNPGLLHCRQILIQLSLKVSPRILEWVAYPFSSRSSQPRISNWGFLHWRWIPYQLSYQGCPPGTYKEYSVQFSSVTQLCLTLCDPMNRSTPGLPVHHQLPEFNNKEYYSALKRKKILSHADEPWGHYTK